MQAAEPANNPLEISNHFVCLKLSLRLSASRAWAGKLGTMADLCVPLSVLCVGDGGGRGPGTGGCLWTGALGVPLVEVLGRLPEAAEPFLDARRCPVPSDVQLLRNLMALSPVACIWRLQLPN